MLSFAAMAQQNSLSLSYGGLTTDQLNDAFSTFFNLQLSPAGFQYGNALRGIVEIGFGYKGIINGEIQYNF